MESPKAKAELKSELSSQILIRMDLPTVGVTYRRATLWIAQSERGGNSTLFVAKAALYSPKQTLIIVWIFCSLTVGLYSRPWLFCGGEPPEICRRSGKTLRWATCGVAQSCASSSMFRQFETEYYVYSECRPSSSGCKVRRSTPHSSWRSSHWQASKKAPKYRNTPHPREYVLSAHRRGRDKLGEDFGRKLVSLSSEPQDSFGFLR